MLTLTPDDMRSFPPEVRAMILRRIAQNAGVTLPTSAPGAAEQVAPEAPAGVGGYNRPWRLADETQARAFVADLSARPIRALHYIAGLTDSALLHSELMAAVGADSRGGIGGVISALTRRLRTVTDDPNANLWSWQTLPDGDSRYRVTPETQAALRRVLDLEG